MPPRPPPAGRRGRRLSYPRIPFATAIADPNLFKPVWDTLHPEQKAVLKMIYALPPTAFDTRLWHALNGGAVIDELGYLVDVADTGLHWPTRESGDITFVIGRRGTKTSIACFVIAYEAICGGHKRFLKKQREQPIFLQVAQDLSTAKANLRHILGYIEMSPIGRAELGNLKDSVTADSIRLPNCGVVMVGPPTIKLRGFPYATYSADEIAFWQKDKESAAPDFEVETAVTSGMGQFPDAKVMRMSSPWTKEGLLYTNYTTGTYGRHLLDAKQREASDDKLVLKGTTAMVNPTLSGRPNPHAYFQRKQAKDGDAFRREHLAEFADAVSGFLPVTLLHRAVSPGIRQRPPVPGVSYVATMDPAFRRDAFAMCIGHMGGNGTFVHDFIGSWRGTSDQPLSPAVALAAIGGLCRTYGINSVLSDQAHIESLQELAQGHGFVVEPHILTWQNKSQMWGEVLTLLNQQDATGASKLRLLDQEDFLTELRGVERILTPSGAIKITGKTGGRRDDLAQCFALCVQRAVQHGGPTYKTSAVVEETTEAGSAAVRSLMAAEIFRPRTVQRSWWAR